MKVNVQRVQELCEEIIEAIGYADNGVNTEPQDIVCAMHESLKLVGKLSKLLHNIEARAATALLEEE